MYQPAEASPPPMPGTFLAAPPAAPAGLHQAIRLVDELVKSKVREVMIALFGPSARGFSARPTWDRRA
jgi:hypothetical protein